MIYKIFIEEYFKKIKTYKYKNILYLLFLEVLIFGLFFFTPTESATPVLSWQPEKIETEIFPGGIREIEVSFNSNIDLENVEFRIVPELEKFITVEPTNLDFVKSGESQTVILNIIVSNDTSLDSIVEGVIQVRAIEKLSMVENFVAKTLSKKINKKKSFARPLPVKIETIDAQPTLDLFEEFLIEEFGTLQPLTQFTGDTFGPTSIPQNILDSFELGTDSASVISVGSLVFLGALTPVLLAEVGAQVLLDEIKDKGIIINDIRSAFLKHDIHEEGVLGVDIHPFADAVIFFPIFALYDKNGNDIVDTFIITLDGDTHSFHKNTSPNTHINDLINRDFFEENNSLNDAAFATIHELLHAMIFRTDCFDREQFDDESIVGAMTNLIDLKVQSSPIFTPRLISDLNEHPEWGNCFSLLGFEKPEPTVSPWPQFQHDARHTGQSPFQGPQTNNIKWTFTPTGTNTFINTPVVGPNGIIYFGAGTQSTGKLIALNPDGTLKWESSPLPSATPTNPAIITDSMVFIVFGSEDFGTNLVALDTDNGSVLWTHPVGNRVDFVTAASDDLIYFTNEDGFLFSLTVSELGATENWSIDLGGIRLVDSAPTVDSTGTIYVIERTISRVTAVNPNGTINWIRTLPANTSASALVLDNDTVVVATPNRLKGLNPVDGTDIFSIFYPGTNPSTPILLPDNRIALVTENNNALHRINTNTQTVDSTFIADFLPTRPNPISDNQGTIYLKTDPDTIVAIANNDIILFSRSFSRLVGNFALSDNNTLYIPVLDGGVLKMVAVGP